MDQSVMDNAARCVHSPQEGTWSMPLSRDLISEQIGKFWSPTLGKSSCKKSSRKRTWLTVKGATDTKGRMWVSSFPLEIRG